ncbi:MAG: Fe(2+)-trafficking protein [Planctomycetota bacterium]
MSNNLEERIAQWEQMCREAPDDMSFLSLGNVYKEADRTEDAAEAFAKAIEHNPQMSRAYHARGQALIKLGREEEAGPLLLTGYEVAAELGEVMPQKSMAALIQKLGLELPEVEDYNARKQEVEASGDQVLDKRTGQPQNKLPDPPMRGPVGAYIYAHFGQDTWKEWIGMGTKVINELRLDFSNPAHQDVYEQHMLEWLGVTKEEVEGFAGSLE